VDKVTGFITDVVLRLDGSVFRMATLHCGGPGSVPGSLCRICGEQSGTGTNFLTEFSILIYLFICLFIYLFIYLFIHLFMEVVDYNRNNNAFVKLYITKRNKHKTGSSLLVSVKIACFSGTFSV